MHSFLKNNVFSISFGTSLSKLAGCLRQVFIAAAFGVGITYDAFNYAYIIPGFLLIIIGGINGPLHNAVVAVLTPLNKKNGGIVLTQVSIKLSILLMGLAILNPIYFTCMMVEAMKTFQVILSVTLGAILGPVFYFFSPEWSILLGGLIAGSIAYLVGEKNVI